MIREEAERLSQQLKIDISQIAREEWEMKILELLFDSSLGQKIYFKGGTALRLAYGSPRYSEDLDFTVFKNITEQEFKIFAQNVAQINPQVKISDFKDKFNTLLTEFKITEPYLSRNFSVKIEISKRQNKNYKYSLRLLTSPVTNIQVLANIEEIKDIYAEKLAALFSRRRSRDIFDIWFIAQKLRLPLPQNQPKILKREIRQELNKFLPLNYQSVVKELEEKYGADSLKEVERDK